MYLKSFLYKVLNFNYFDTILKYIYIYYFNKFLIKNNLKKTSENRTSGFNTPHATSLPVLPARGFS
jgi:hypothetical protein